jgi:hypothetical protein
VPRPLPLIGQIAAYALFASGLGYFSANPAYTHADPQLALIRLSLDHAGQHQGDCRRLTPEEIAKLPPRERRPLDCQRERFPVAIELALDGRPLVQAVIPPSGLSRDGPSFAYRRFPVPAGRHLLEARLRDGPRTEGYDYERRVEIVLVPGQNFVVAFRPDRGGFILQ